MALPDTCNRLDYLRRRYSKWRLVARWDETRFTDKTEQLSRISRWTGWNVSYLPIRLCVPHVRTLRNPSGSENQTIEYTNRRSRKPADVEPTACNHKSVLHKKAMVSHKENRDGQARFLNQWKTDPWILGDQCPSAHHQEP